jgi:membrane protease subunit HflC
METSRSLASKNTTMVLPIDSPLFAVLLDSRHSNGGAPASNAMREELRGK